MKNRNERVDYMAADIGELVEETFSIKVKGEDDVVLYEDAKSPFTWRKVSTLAEIFQRADAPLSDDQINFVAQAFPSDEQGAVLVDLIALYNDAERAREKGNAYQKLMNQYKPASEEDKAKAFERAVQNFAKALSISETEARALVLAAQGKA